MSDHEDDDDDIYGTGEPATAAKKDEAESSGGEPMDDADSGDDDDDSESDLEIIIDTPMPAAKPAVQAQPQESRAIKIEAPPQPSQTPSQTPSQAPRTLATGSVPQLSVAPGTAYPALKLSTLDVNGDPVYPPQNKTLLQVDMDADLAEEQKIWRRPGEDQSDYFNYGFDEFTWEIYRQRQLTMADTLQNQKSDMAQMQQMMGGGPMPGMPAPAANNAPANAPSGPAGPGGAMNEEQQMHLMFSQMASQGMDLSNMDFNSFMQMAGGFPGGPGGPGGPGPQQGGYPQGNQGGGGRGRGRGRGW